MTTATLPTPAPPRATLDDLMKVEGKAELIGGRIVHFMAAGHRHNRLGFKITRSLDDHADAIGRGVAYTDNMGFTVPELLSGRESFSPDAAYYTGPLPVQDTGFVRGAPDFAVEVRSEGDCGRTAERELAEKRADYFEAGTKAVWDVDPKTGTILLFLAGEREPTRFAAGDVAHAGPAVPGWTMPVAQVFQAERGQP